MHRSKQEIFMGPFSFELDDEPKLASTSRKLSEYCKSKKNTTLFRLRFLKYKQQKGQTFHDYVA